LVWGAAPKPRRALEAPFINPLFGRKPRSCLTPSRPFPPPPPLQHKRLTIRQSSTSISSTDPPVLL
jgi:hypothetical protein